MPVGNGGRRSPGGPRGRADAPADAPLRPGDGRVHADQGRGGLQGQRRGLVRSAAGEELEPGWRTRVGFANFTSIVTDPLIREPFLRVFVWTFVFAFIAVFLSFALGLFLAIALDKRGMRFQRSYRSLLVIPFAIPASSRSSSGPAC